MPTKLPDLDYAQTEKAFEASSSQREAARLLNVSQQWLSKHVAGRKDLRQLALRHEKRFKEARGLTSTIPWRTSHSQFFNK